MVSPDSPFIFFAFKESYAKVLISSKSNVLLAMLEFILQIPLLTSEVGACRLLHALLFQYVQFFFKGIKSIFNFVAGLWGLPRGLDIYFLVDCLIVLLPSKVCFQSNVVPQSFHRFIDILIGAGGLQAEGEIKAK